MDERLPVWLWGSIIIAIVGVVGVFDWITGYEFDILLFYFLPVSLAAWFLGLGPLLATAVLCSLVWVGADILSGHEYSSHFYAVWNTLIRLASFIAIGWSVYKIRHLLDHERKISAELRQALSEIKVLEAILPICAQCKKIRDEDGQWQQLEAFIGKQFSTQFSHGYCPECAQKALAEVGLVENKED